MATPWYLINDVETLDTPALIFYPQRIKQNIELAKGYVNSPARLRPHVKTHKCLEVTRLMLDAGITKFKCATIAEAEMLAIAQAPDVLLAYQPVKAKALRLVELIKKYPLTKFSCLVDNLQSAEMISETALRAGVVIDVYIDVNIGMNRTGILPGGVAALYQDCSALNGLNLQGLHAYDGHIDATDVALRRAECMEAYALLEQVLNDLRAKGFQPKIAAGGTPTFPFFAEMPDVDCSPGTFVLWDAGYGQHLPDLPFVPAALVLTRVISILDDHTVCLDLGHKAIAAEHEFADRVVFLNAPDVRFISHSEEHLVIKTPLAHQFKIGDVLYGLPIHICPTCALYNAATIVTDSEIQGTWEIMARTRSITV